MAKLKHIKNPLAYPLVFPTLEPPLELEPGQVVRVPHELDLPDVETVTAKAFKGTGQAPLHASATQGSEQPDLGVDDGVLIERAPLPTGKAAYEELVAEHAARVAEEQATRPVVDEGPEAPPAQFLDEHTSSPDTIPAS